MNEPNDPITKFHQLLDADPLDPELKMTDLDDVDLISDPELNAALSTIGLGHLSPEAQQMVLDLTPSSASLDPHVRAKLMNAAARALRTRRDNSSPLPRLLFLSRRTSKEDIKGVAAAVGVPAEKLEEVERGRARVDELTTQNVASWIRHFDVPTVQAEVALRKSLAAPTLQDIAAGAPSRATTDADQFVADVIALLGD